MKLISFQKLGENRQTPRVWLESGRLTELGFPSGNRNSLFSRTADEWDSTATSSALKQPRFKRIAALRECPIIDITNRTLLSPLDGFPEIKVTAAFRRIDVTPSVRGFNIRRGLSAKPPFKVRRIQRRFCFKRTSGGFTQRNYRPTKFSSPQSPARAIQLLGERRSHWPEKPELGDTGDLYLCVAQIVAHHLPSACVFENVPAFKNSLACLRLVHHLERIGYGHKVRLAQGTDSLRLLRAFAAGAMYETVETVAV